MFEQKKKQDQSYLNLHDFGLWDETRGPGENPSKCRLPRRIAWVQKIIFLSVVRINIYQRPKSLLLE